MQLVSNDYDLRFNYYAFLACIKPSDENEKFLSCSKALSKFGISEYTEDADIVALAEDVKIAEEYLGEKLIKVKPARYKTQKRVTPEIAAQMNRLYHGLEWSMDKVGALYGLQRDTLRYYIKNKRPKGWVKHEGD